MEEEKIRILEKMRRIDREYEDILITSAEVPNYNYLYYKRLPLLNKQYNSLLIELVLGMLIETKEEIRELKRLK